MPAILEWTILGIGLYLAFGLLFAVAFILGGVERVSPASRGTGWAFRLLIVPGSAVFWPWLTFLWVRPAAPPPEANEIEEAAIGETLLDPEAETQA